MLIASQKKSIASGKVGVDPASDTLVEDSITLE
jgi:hypothetical protein